MNEGDRMYVDELQERIQELEEASLFKSERIALLVKENIKLQSRIEALEASTIHEKYVSAMGLITPCQPYLKDGETPAECIQRNRDDAGAVLKLLAKEKRKYDALVAGIRSVVNKIHAEEWHRRDEWTLADLRALLEDDDE